MLIIDKGNMSGPIKLYMTLAENTTIEDAFYLMVLQSPDTNKTHRIQLINNSADFTDRVDVYQISIGEFDNLAGLYYYSIFESADIPTSEIGLGKPVELGLLKVISDSSVEYVSIFPAEEEDDIITYNT
jgi:hypothetical protein